MAARFLLRGAASAAARSAGGHRLSVPFGAFAGPGGPSIVPAAEGPHCTRLSSPFSSIPEVDKAVGNSELDALKPKRRRSAIAKTRGEAMMFPLQFHYEDVLRQDLLLKLNHANVTQVPGLFEVRLVPKAASELKIPIGKLAMEILSGQSLVETQKGPSTKAGKANPFLAAEKDTASAFERQSILRGHGMYHFLVRFLTAASMLDSPVKIQENAVKISMEMEFCEFSPELEDHFEIFEHIRGFNVTVVTSASTKDETLLLWSGILQKDEGGS